MMSQGVYDIPRIGFDAAVALTNTTPVGAFRGAGRPEATAYLERLMDLAADELGLDPVELRRRNFLKPEQFPFTTVPGAPYDIGDYDLPMREALRLVGYDELRAEQARRREAGDPVQLGIGVCVYVEITAGGGGSEFGSVTRARRRHGHDLGRHLRARPGPRARRSRCSRSDRLGIPIEKIRFVQSDTAAVPRGGGTGGSRSLQLAGSAVQAAADDVLEQARRRAADLLEAAVDDVELTEDGAFGVAGVPSATVTWAQVAAAAADDGEELAAGHDHHQDGADVPVRRARRRSSRSTPRPAG